MGKIFLKTLRNEGERQTSKESSTLGKCWWNQEDIPSLQSTTVPYPILKYEAHILEYKRAKQPWKIQNDQKHDSARETPNFLHVRNKM